MEGIIFPSHSCPLRFRLFLRLSIAFSICFSLSNCTFIARLSSLSIDASK